MYVLDELGGAVCGVYGQCAYEVVWDCGELGRSGRGCRNGYVAINLARVCTDDVAVQVSRQFYGE